LQLTRRSNPLAASSISPDGKLLVAMELTTDGYDLALLPLDGTGQIQPLIQTSFEEIYGEISPDGQWLAYQSNELGHNEVFVRPFPDVGRGRWQVSRGGGQHPLWARSGRELFYIAPSPSALMAVGIQSEASFSTANPVKLFDAPRYLTTGSGRSYDVTADGRRFLMIKQPVLDGIEPAPPITVVLNWTEELKNRVSGQ
jgi:serine/threonine-protein kinase